MAGAGPQFAARLDLATLTDVPAEPSDVLVIDMIDVIDTEGADLASRGVTASPWPPPTRTTARPAASAIAPFALWTPEPGAWASPGSSVTIRSGPS